MIKPPVWLSAARALPAGFVLVASKFPAEISAEVDPRVDRVTFCRRLPLLPSLGRLRGGGAPAADEAGIAPF